MSGVPTILPAMDGGGFEYTGDIGSCKKHATAKSVMNERIGFVGGGQMAKALAKGFVTADLVRADDVAVADVSAAALEDFQAVIPGAKAVHHNVELVEICDIVFLAVKPQNIEAVSAQVADAVQPETLFVSICAGVTIEELSRRLGTDRIIRVMPNTPSLVGKGAAAFSCGSGASDSDATIVRQLLDCVGISYRLDEKLLDAITGLSGSGPAFVYQFIEALGDGGVRMGLPRAVAHALATQTVLGAAEMVVQTGEHPAVLKDRVASPGGTTIAGLQALEQGGLRGTVIAAVEAATRRSIELGQ